MEYNAITLEEHFLSDAYLADLSSSPSAYSEQLKHIPNLLPQLRDLGDARLARMDRGGIALQVVSHAPGAAAMSPARCRAANDQLDAAVALHPRRLAGFAALPMADPAAAAAELRRCVRDLGFLGTLVDNHAPVASPAAGTAREATYYDGAAYHVFWAAAQELDVPVYLHPTWPTESVHAALYAPSASGDADEDRETPSFSEAAALSLGASGFGWHADVGLHFLRLFAAGLFDRFPRLRLVLGHMGEMVPFVLERVCVLSRRWGARQRDLQTVWGANVWVTTSGVWGVAPLACVLRNTAPERVLYSVDYPFATVEDGARFLRQLRESGLVTEAQFWGVVRENARALLGLDLRHG